MAIETASETLEFVENLYRKMKRPLPHLPMKFCELKGKRVAFDYLCQGDLKSGIEFYDNANYVGSGHRAWYDGVLTEFETLQHFL